MTILDSPVEEPRRIRGFEITLEVTTPWSSTTNSTLSTHYIISKEICSDSTDLKIKLKSIWEIVPPNLDPSPH